MRLVWFETRHWLKSPVFYAALAIIIFFVAGQIGGEFWSDAFTWPEPPTPGLTETEQGLPAYGWKQDTSEEAQMRRVTREMFLAIWENPVQTPALGGFINRQVRLSQEQIDLVREAFTDVTGKRPEEVDGYNSEMNSIVPYSDFAHLMEMLNKALGGDFFTLDPYVGDYVPRTYEEALADYAELTAGGELTWSNARMFADYMGIALGIFPAFLAAFIMGRDKRSGANALIGSRPISGPHYLAVKYLGLALPLCAFVMLVALVPTVGGFMMRAQGHVVDVWAYLAISAGWLLPTALAVTALALFLAEATGTGIAAIPVVILWWMVSVARPGLMGPYPAFVSLIRFNFTQPLPTEWTSQIAINRACMVALSAGLVLLSGLIYDRKRARGDRYV